MYFSYPIGETEVGQRGPFPAKLVDKMVKAGNSMFKMLSADAGTTYTLGFPRTTDTMTDKEFIDALLNWQELTYDEQWDMLIGPEGGGYPRYAKKVRKALKTLNRKIQRAY